MILSLLFPKNCVSCGAGNKYFCEKCKKLFWAAASICPMCWKGSIGGLTHVRCRKKSGMEGLVSVFSYKGGIKSAIKKLKYRFVTDLADEFMDLSLEKADVSLLSFFQREQFQAVPVPLHLLRERWRGFNQAELLAKLLAEKSGIHFSPILRRVLNTVSLAELAASLTGKEKAEIVSKFRSVTQRKMAERKLLRIKKIKSRREQMKGAFKLGGGARVKERNILLVDDVWTSGSTMLECARVLKRQGCGKVWGFTIAQSRSF